MGKNRRVKVHKRTAVRLQLKAGILKKGLGEALAVGGILAADR